MECVTNAKRLLSHIVTITITVKSDEICHDLLQTIANCFFFELQLPGTTGRNWTPCWEQRLNSISRILSGITSIM